MHSPSKQGLAFIAAASTAVAIISGGHAKADPIPDLIFTNTVNQVDTTLFGGTDYTSWTFTNNSSTTISNLTLDFGDLLRIITGNTVYQVLSGPIPINTSVDPGESINLFDWVPASPPPPSPVTWTPDPDNVNKNLVVRASQKVPAPLPLLGVGAAFGYSRKLRKRIKTRKSPEVMSAIG